MSRSFDPKAAHSTNRSTTDAPWVDGRTIGDVLHHTARSFADRTAIVFQNVHWSRTWREFDNDVDKAAKALLACGIRKGDHFGVWATNIPAWAILQFATARIGAVLVTINPSYRTSELAFVIKQADLKGLALIDHFKTTLYHDSLKEAIPELSSAQPGKLVSPNFPHLKLVLNLRGNSLAGSLTGRSFSIFPG
jgi:fatty-acyl-CoA synthase